MEVADLSKVSDQLDNGYAQSKWVSEQMCHEAAQRGLPVSGTRRDAAHPKPLATSEERRLFRVLYCCNSQQEVGNDGFYGMEAQSAPRCHHRDCSIGVKKLAAGIDSFEIYLQSDKVFDSRISSELLQTAGISYPSVNKELLVTYTAQ
ncbi:hypothetical protein PsorP6_017932 [Peronosclerospora sorghi]|uniref:Uncharacterized protein n=1 Tax=Peronosclerospora sorghi TaxID=230839 RepID=A0ACC0WDJ5_9STRA|nr:hypothetical protein PsorP6_017932 [Peronosclerospora sorghi]